MLDTTNPAALSPTRLSAFIDDATRAGDRKKAFMVVDGEAFRYGDLIDRMSRLYTVFRDKGLEPGARVGVVTRTPVEMACLVLAGLRAGLAVINLNPDLSPPERRHAIGAAKLAHVFADREIVDQAPMPADVKVTIIEPRGRSGGGLMGRLLGRSDKAGASGLAAEIAAASAGEPPRLTAEDAVALMLFTSGTTSRPKVVQLTQTNLAAQIETFRTVYDYDPDARLLNPLPLHFTDGILHGPLITFLSGATLYRPRVFQFQEMEQLLDGIYRDRITHFITVPALLSVIDRLHDRFNDAFRTEDFRYIRSSGDRLPETLWRSIEERFGVRVVNTYGLSETVCEALYCGPDPARFKIGTIGKPVDCEVMIVDDEGRPVATGERGELLIRGDNIMLGYLGQPELTAETMLDDWFRTGDLAALDADGFVSIVGRKKTLIISGGVNVQPQDVVDALLTHPAVADAHVLGLPDRVFGEVVGAAVVLRDGAGAAPSAADLVEHCRALLAPTKVPRRIVAVAALPRNPAGKVLADRVRELFGPADGGEGPDRSGSVEDQVIALAAAVFGTKPSELRPSAEPRTTLGWDSFAHINLVTQVERHFDVKLSARDVLSIARLGDLAEAVARQVGGGHGA